MRESDFLNWIYKQSRPDARKVPIGPGDDMAMLHFDRDRLLVATDQVIDGVHIDLAEAGAEAAGRKALARNLSDIAAMAALPVAAVASVALPKGFDQPDAEAIYQGLAKLGEEFACPLVGGDVSSTPGPLTIGVTVLAKPAGATGGIEPVRRDGGRARNALCVTGRLGGAWRSKRHLEFTPRVREAILLAVRYKLRAMIDISDGLVMDLDRLCRAGGTGAEIWADAIPVHPEATAGRDIDPLEAALYDGEDYELLFSLPAGQAKAVTRDEKIPLPITQIGRLTRESGIVLVRPNGRREKLEPRGWDPQT